MLLRKCATNYMTNLINLSRKSRLNITKQTITL